MNNIPQNKPLILLQSALFTRSGYGMWSLDLAKSLLKYCKKKDYELVIAPTAWGACSLIDMPEFVKNPEVKELTELVLKGNLNRQPDVYFHISIPNEFTPHGKFNIGISALVETTVLPPTFVEGLNRMNLNLVMSNFNKEVAIKTEYIKKNPNNTTEPLKLNRPMEVLPWGVDTSIYKKTAEKIQSIEEELAKIPETFAFFFSGQWTHNHPSAERKGIPQLIETFLKAFAGVENPPCLILKTNGAQIGTIDRHDIVNKLNDITNSVKHHMPTAKLPNVYVIYGQLTDAEMNALWNSDKIKVNISFSHGESWGLSGLTGTVLDIPTLVPNWSGHCDYLNPQYCDFLDHQLVDVPREAHNDWFVEKSQWCNVIPEKAAEKMKSYFFNYNDTIIENAKKLGTENREKFDITRLDERFHALLDKYIPELARQQAIVLPKLKKITLPQLKKIE